jgi:hypothetical protein
MEEEQLSTFAESPAPISPSFLGFLSFFEQMVGEVDTGVGRRDREKGL